MKAVYKILVLLLGVSLLCIGSCSEDEETCKTMDFNNPYEVKFDLSVKVVYEDGTPYDGTVTYEIRKRYCDGTENGEYIQNGVTDPKTGYWSPPVKRGYNYTNPDDRVEVSWKVEGNGSKISNWNEPEVRGETKITHMYTYTIKK